MAAWRSSGGRTVILLCVLVNICMFFFFTASVRRHPPGAHIDIRNIYAIREIKKECSK